MPTLESLRQRMTPFLFLNHFSRVLANSWFNVHLGYGGARTSMTSFFRGAADSQSLVKFACSKLQMSNHLGVAATHHFLISTAFLERASFFVPKSCLHLMGIRIS